MKNTSPVDSPVVGGLLYTRVGQAQLPDPTHDHAHIGFGRVLSDAIVLQFAQRHEVILQYVGSGV